MNSKEIAALPDVSVTEKTLRSWKESGKWEEMKAALTISKNEIVSNFYQEVLAMQRAAKEENRRLTHKETDALVKIASSIEKIEKKTSLPLIITTIQEFFDYLQTEDHAASTAIIPYMKKYIAEKAKI